MQAGSSAGSSGSRQPRLFSSILCSVLVRAPLRLGLLFLEPPLLGGAADFVLANQLDPGAREQLAALAEAARWRHRFGPDDDVHILWQSLARYIPSFALAGGSMHGCLDSTFARTVRGTRVCSVHAMRPEVERLKCSITLKPHQPRFCAGSSSWHAGAALP